MKVNTVLVSKNLAQAQFRCLECQKVFISYRHLEKHSVRRHLEPLHGSAIMGQDEAFWANDRKLNEVAGRLEKVLSLLETRAVNCVDNRASTAWVGPSPCASPDNLSPILEGNCRNIYVYPASVSDVRKSVSLFTLPNDRKLDPGTSGFGTEDAELCHHSAEEPNPKSAEIADGFEVMSTEGIAQKEMIVLDDQEETNSASSTQVDISEKNSENTVENDLPLPTTIERHHIEAAGTLGPLIVDLINKLEKVSIEPKLVASSCCQTSDTENDAVLAGAKYEKPTTNGKTVRFSENLYTIIDDLECSCQTESHSAEKYENEEYDNRSSVEDNKNCIVEDDEHQSLTSSVEDEEYIEESDLADHISSSDASKHVPPNLAEINSKNNEGSNSEAGGNVKMLTNSCINHHSEQCESGQMLVRFPDVEQERENECALPQPEKGPLESKIVKQETPQCFQNSKDIAKTKRQILELVEECLKEFKSSSATTLKSGSSNLSAPDAFETTACTLRDGNNIIFHGTDSKIDQHAAREIKKPDELLEHSPLEEGTLLNKSVCVKYESTTSFPGMVAPSTIICKDGGLDIDDMSGNSYEQFMKRFSSDFLNNRKAIEEQINRISLARKTSVDSVVGQAYSCASTLPIPGLGSAVTIVQNSESEIPRNLPQPLTTRNGSDAQVGPGIMGLKKSEYAVLLHHETSQVQNLIDTLVMDLQKWRSAKKNELSKAIRFQLEEKLSSNLNLLGIHDRAKSLSDTAMTSVNFLLNRRSKAVKGSKSSYLNTLKTAFETEIDRIAKSRKGYPF